MSETAFGTPILEVERLQVSFPRPPTGSGGAVRLLRAVDDVSFALTPGRTLGLIGESGSGKSVTAHALLRLIPSPGRLRADTIRLRTRAGVTDLASLDPASEAMRRIRGREIAMVFQDAVASLSPVRTIGAQLRESIQLHRRVNRVEATRAATEWLERVGFRDPGRHLGDYAHQLSGGMGQRVALALALCGAPRVLIADEPTTALDPPVQHQIVTLLRRLQRELGMAILFITHDLGLAEEACDDVAVLYLGRIVETAPASMLMTRPLHPYTARLLESTPRLGQRRPRLPTLPGVLPQPIDLPWECGFAPRCDRVEPRCRDAVPALVEVEPRHHVRCYLHHDAPERPR